MAIISHFSSFANRSPKRRGKMATLSHQVISEEKKEEDFYRSLHQFMKKAGIQMTKIPVMGKNRIDLYRLFWMVNYKYEGFWWVVKNVGTWSKIW